MSSPIPAALRPHDSGCVLTLRVQPKSSRSGPVGEFREAVKWAVHSPAKDGEANDELVRGVAEFFRLPKSAIEILSGHRSRDKQLLLGGLSPADAARALAPHL